MAQGTLAYFFIILTGLLGPVRQTSAFHGIQASQYYETDEKSNCQDLSESKMIVHDIILNDNDNMFSFPIPNQQKNLWYQVVKSSIPVLRRTMFRENWKDWIKEICLENTNISRMENSLFHQFDYLRCLDLSRNHLNELSSNAFGSLQRLVYLDISSNNITFMETDTFFGLSALQNLNISRNYIRKIGNNCFQGLTSLKMLNLSSNQLSSLDSQIFNGLSGLVHLDLSKNPISTISTNIYFEPLIALENLYVREIANNSNLFNSVYFANMLHTYKHLQAIFVSEIEFISCSQFHSIITYASSRHVNFVTSYYINSKTYYSELCKYEDTNNQLRKMVAAWNALINQTAGKDVSTNTSNQLMEYAVAVRTLLENDSSSTKVILGFMLMTLLVIMIIMSSIVLYNSNICKYLRLRMIANESSGEGSEAVMLK